MNKQNTSRILVFTAIIIIVVLTAKWASTKFFGRKSEQKAKVQSQWMPMEILEDVMTWQPKSGVISDSPAVIQEVSQLTKDDLTTAGLLKRGQRVVVDPSIQVKAIPESYVLVCWSNNKEDWKFGLVRSSSLKRQDSWVTLPDGNLTVKLKPCQVATKTFVLASGEASPWISVPSDGHYNLTFQHDSNDIYYQVKGKEPVLVKKDELVRFPFIVGSYYARFIATDGISSVKVILIRS